MRAHDERMRVRWLAARALSAAIRHVVSGPVPVPVPFPLCWGRLPSGTGTGTRHKGRVPVPVLFRYFLRELRTLSEAV